MSSNYLAKHMNDMNHKKRVYSGAKAQKDLARVNEGKQSYSLSHSNKKRVPKG